MEDLGVKYYTQEDAIHLLDSLNSRLFPILPSSIDLQHNHNHYSNDPECAVDAFVEDIEHDEDGKYANISYQ